MHIRRQTMTGNSDDRDESEAILYSKLKVLEFSSEVLPSYSDV